MNKTLLIMAAGMGSRFKGGIKQLCEIGPNGETILELNLNDALKVGFNKFVFIIRKELEDILKEKVNKYPNIYFCYQEIDSSRTKPWGTGEAILKAKDIINEPFVVINADDYYGVDAFSKAYDYLEENNNYGAVLYKIENTLSKYGEVNRGVCEINDNKLVSIEETKHISLKDNNVVSINKILNNSYVSMNFWIIKEDIFNILESKFNEFKNDFENKDNEFLFPDVIKDLINNGKIVNVLISNEPCIGITYMEDVKEFKDYLEKLK